MNASGPRPLTIGIDARAAAEEPGGRGRYVRELLAHLAELGSRHRFLLYARLAWQPETLGAGPAWRLSPRPDGAWHLGVALRASRECDVFLSTNSYLTAWFLRVPSCVVVHDMVAFDRELRPQRRASLIERATLAPAVRRAAAIVAVSASTERDLVARFPAAEGRTRVIHHAADPSFEPVGADDATVLARHGLDRPYVLVTGTLEPRKNLPRLIEAYAHLPARLRDRVELVLVGATGWETDETFDSIARQQGRVRALGYVPDADLPALYRRAEVFAYPSLYEGFGLPILEAMRSGTAVLTSRVSSLPEVGGEAVRYVDPRDVSDIRSGLAELLDEPDLRARLAGDGLIRADRFRWSTTARQTVEALEAAAGSPSARR
jgi:alpha-1,3-rhamnosyl/mannosyltransferase